jgi:hypothetical protein
MADGVHFMHASSPRNYGKVVVDSRISSYLARYKSDAGIPRRAAAQVERGASCRAAKL